MRKRRHSNTVLRGLLTWLLVPVVGAVLGGAAAWLQLRLLRYGMLAEEQLAVFRGWFFGSGLVLALCGALLGRAILAARARTLIGASLLPAALFLVLLPANLRGMPDVYLLVTDATRADHLSLYGYERSTTPFLEEFAAQAIVFRNGISQGTHTIVSTPSLLASCYPSQHGIRGYTNVLSDQLTLLPEYLAESGYGTYAYVTNPHLSPGNGFAQGFERYEHDPNWAHTSAALVNESFLSWLDGRGRGEPVFSLLFYIDPHNPYLSPEPWSSLFDPEWRAEPVSDWKHEWGRPDPDRLRNLVAQYDGAIAYWDDELGKLIDRLNRRGRLDNALIVYTSDHGEEFWEHGFWGHNKTIYEGSIHVPLVISFPVPLRFPPLPRVSRSVDGVVSGVDVLPTVLGYLGIVPTAGSVGSSALPMVFGADDGAERVAYCEEILTEYGPYDIRGIRTRDRKYIRIFDFEGDSSGEELFFDLDRDPGEQRNLIHDEPRPAEEHARIFDDLMWIAAREAASGVEETDIDPAALERLSALGYVGN